VEHALRFPGEPRDNSTVETVDPFNGKETQMAKTSLDEALSTWSQLLEGIEANQGDLPHIEDYGEQLEMRLKDLKVLRERRKRLQTKVYRATREYKSHPRRGEGSGRPHPLQHPRTLRPEQRQADRVRPDAEKEAEAGGETRYGRDRGPPGNPACGFRRSRPLIPAPSRPPIPTQGGHSVGA
jgi:hypothetical protein